MESSVFPLANGLVFDSRAYSPVSDVSPVLPADSSSVNMQHMAVVKDFRISFSVTNLVPVSPPVLQFVGTNAVHWTGPSNLAYTVQRSGTLTNWQTAGTISSSTTNYSFTNAQPFSNWNFFRVVYP